MLKSTTIYAGVFVAALAAGTAAQAAPVTVTSSGNANALAQALVGNGITISNATYTGSNLASGFFTGGTQAGFAVNQGIVLTSGYASNAGQTYSDGQPSTDNGAAGTPIIANSNNATTLSFQFTSNTTVASFSYLFASAEYQGYVNSQYNDAFKFLFNGQNIAKVPGTDLDVAVNNVNNGGATAPGTNPSNPQYYVANTKGQNPNNPYGGLTSIFTASISGLTPGVANTLTLVIADVQDRSLDSAVFLVGGSFTNQPPPTAVPEPASLALFGAGLLGLAATRRLRRKAS